MQHTATPGYKPIEPAPATADYSRLDDAMLKRVWKDAKKWFDAYKSARYKKKTREAKQAEYLAVMNEVEIILLKRGVDVTKFLNIQTDEA